MQNGATRPLAGEKANQRRIRKKIKAHKIQYANCARNIPMKENSVYVVYASHVLNIMLEVQMARFLGEMNRVLRVGGILRLSVPCFDRYV